MRFVQNPQRQVHALLDVLAIGITILIIVLKQDEVTTWRVNKIDNRSEKKEEEGQKNDWRGGKREAGRIRPPRERAKKKNEVK